MNDQKYKLYGIFRLCKHCGSQKPLAVGVTHQSSILRLIKYRVLRRNYCPKEIRDDPKNFTIQEIERDLNWVTAYTLSTKYECQNVPVLTLSRT